MKIINLSEGNTVLIDQIETLLESCFVEYSPEWNPTKKDRLEEIYESFDANRSSRVLVNEEEKVLGWVAAFHDKHVWEIHPIAISPEAQRKGLGRMLIDDISKLAKESGAEAVWAGTSDETGSTSFSRFDLYSDLKNALENISVPENHPINFWLKMGFSIVGVMPDEEGLGKPGIHFLKRIV